MSFVALLMFFKSKNAPPHMPHFYTQILVIEQEDIDNLPKFIAKLRDIPFQTRISDKKGSFVNKVRRVFVENVKEAVALPWAHPDHLRGKKGPSSSLVAS